MERYLYSRSFGLRRHFQIPTSRFADMKNNLAGCNSFSIPENNIPALEMLRSLRRGSGRPGRLWMIKGDSVV